MNLVISKQRLRDIDGFFAKSFFLFTLRKNLSWGTKYVYERTIPFIFFSDLPWKRYSGIETGHVQFSNIFSHEKPRTFRLKKKMKHKKNGSIEREKKLWQGFVQFLILSKIQKDENTASTVFAGKRQPFQ